MPEQPAPEPSPEQRFRDAMRKILDVSKPEIVKREHDYRQERSEEKQKRKGS